MLLSMPYRIETKRLVIRCWNPADAWCLEEAIVESLDHLLPWMPWAVHEPLSIDDRIALLREFRVKYDSNVDFIMGAFDREEKKVIGGTGLHRRAEEGVFEIGYWIRLGEINKGYATEITTALTRAGFEVKGTRRMEIHSSPDNGASMKVIQNAGYTFEGTRREALQLADKQWYARNVYTMLKSEFEASTAYKESTTIHMYDCAGRQLL